MNSKKINIGLDLNGVIIDHTQNIIKAGASLGFELNEEDTQSEALKVILTVEKYKELKNIIFDNMTKDSVPMILSIKTIKSLSKKYSLFIISQQDETGSKKTLNWLEKYNIFNIIPKENVIFVKKPVDKNVWCKKLDIETYLDDKISVLDLLSYPKNKILFNPFKILNKSNYTEISSWEEFPILLKKFENGNLI